MRQKEQSYATADRGSQTAARKGIVAPVAAAITIGLAAGVALGTAFFVTGDRSDQQVASVQDEAVEPAVALAQAESATETKTDRAVAPQLAATDASATDPVIAEPWVQLPEQAPVIAAAFTAGDPDDVVVPAEPAPQPAQLAARFGDELPGVDSTSVALPNEVAGSLPQAEPALPVSETAAVATVEQMAPAPTPADDTALGVEIAQSEAEVLAIEERLTAAGAAYFQLPQDAAEPFDAALSDSPALPPARTNAWVNLRTGPDNDAEIMMVVPGGAEIAAEEGCPHWCEVVYEGQRGYIYQSFIRR